MTGSDEPGSSIVSPAPRHPGSAVVFLETDDVEGWTATT
jgi:hypothetical protein